MVFPQTPLPVQVELQINGLWTDITSDVYTADKITIERGRADEGKRVDPGKCSLTLNNRLGKYSPRNPLSPYFGQIGRNTPIRVSVFAGSTYLATSGSTAVNIGISTPDATALDITGDLDIRFEAALQNWTASGSVELCGKGLQNTNQRSWLLMMRDGRLHLEWSTAGTSTLSVDSTTLLPAQPGRRLAVRATLDVNNGASGNTATFYYADSIAGPWTQLGAPVVTAGTTSIFNSSAPVTVGNGWTDLGFPSPNGQIYAFELRSGINGTVVANPSFTAQTPGTTSFADAAGRTWTVLSASELTNRQPRFVGEVSSWPTRWDVSGKDVRVPIDAAGVLRRYGQGKKAIDSTLRRRVPSFNPVAYWPMEEPDGATQAYSPVPGVLPLTPTGVRFGADDTLGGASTVPSWDVGADAKGFIPNMPSGAWHVECVMRLDTMPGSLETLMEVQTTGTAKLYRVSVQTNNVRFDAIDVDGNTLDSINSIAPLFTGRWNRFQIFVLQAGGNVETHLVWRDVSGTALAVSHTYAGTEGRPTSVRVMGVDGNLRLGHLGVFTVPNTLAYANADDGFAGENAGNRISRLASEEGKPVNIYGSLNSQEKVGAQRPGTFLDLIEEAADVDSGILYERRESLGLAYRDRNSLYNQPVSLTLDYNKDGHVAPPLEPVDDDQAVRNDRTIQRTGGSSSRAVLEDGPLSVQDPPLGVGPYDDSETLNLYTDGQTVQQAGWRLHLGTVDEARYPVVNINLAAAPALIDQVLQIDSGSRAEIINPPAFLPPGPIDLLAQGYKEVIGHPTDWDVSLNCTPASPWTVGVIEDPVLGKADTEGTVLSSGVSATATSLPVTVTAGPVWTTSPAQYPFDLKLGGEVVTATACTGAGPSQTFTVVRSVNGIVKSQPSGTDVRLAQPAPAAL